MIIHSGTLNNDVRVVTGCKNMLILHTPHPNEVVSFSCLKVSQCPVSVGSIGVELHYTRGLLLTAECDNTHKCGYFLFAK